MIREITIELLQNMGYQAEFAKKGNKAIALYREAQDTGKLFDAVILDLTAPGGMDGKNNGTASHGRYKIKVISSSSYSTILKQLSVKNIVFADYHQTT